MYKGEVQVGKEVVARIDSVQTAGPVALIMVAAAPGQPSIKDAAEAAPNGFAEARVTPKHEGRLEVVVALGAGESARLTVREAGVVKDAGGVSSHTQWDYAVLP